MAHPAMYPAVTDVWSLISDVHLWLLAGWFVFSLAVAVVVGGGK